MITESQIEDSIKVMFEGLEFARDPQGLYDPLRYMIGIGGKRIRPRLCLLTYSLFKNRFTDEILQPAAGLEVFHSFTLLHDDIMDNADVRRGVPTVCRKWDDNTAILSGDVMCIDSYRRIGMAPHKYLGRVLDLFNTTAAQVCEGQQYDMDFEALESVSMDQYMQMIGLKTGVLIACSAKMGAIIGGASDKACEELYNYGYELGLAFQIADDWLDTFGDPAVFGKAIGGDILNGKKTWLLTRAFEKAESEDCKDDLLRAMGMPAATDEEKASKIEAVRRMYVSLAVDSDAQQAIRRYTDAAMAHAAKAGLSKFRVEMLNRYADRLVGRTF